MAKKVLTLTIAWILLGLCLSYLITGTSGWWADYYFVWDKGKDFLLILTLCFLFSEPVKSILKALLVFLFIRLIWEALAIPHYETASGTEIMDILFALNLIIIVFIIIKSGVWRLK